MFSKTTSKLPGFCAAFCSTPFEQEIAVRQLATQVLKSSFQSEHHQLLWFHKSAMPPDKLHYIRSVNKTRLLTELAILKARVTVISWRQFWMNEEMRFRCIWRQTWCRMDWSCTGDFQRLAGRQFLTKTERDSCVDFQNKSNAKRPSFWTSSWGRVE